jgi:signal transduction histidine kinase
VETQLKLLEQKRTLQENYKKLGELEKLRDSLVHMIVHDLRSPLSAICAFLGFLKEDAKGVLSVQASEDMDETLKSANKMIQMVSTLLDASKLEEGKMKLNLAECDLAAVLENAIAAIRPLAGTRRLTLEPGNGSAKVLADAELVARVAQNLLSNAIKFAPAEGGYVRLDIKPAGTGARISVANNGPAIPPEHQEKIFEKFGQLETRRAKNSFSTGLGLNFCKLAVEAHGGSVGVSSEEGGETVFWFELPAKGPAVKAAPAREPMAELAGETAGHS